MIRRVPACRIRSLDDVAAAVDSRSQRSVLIFDADNTLAPQGAPAKDFGALVNDAIDRFEANAAVARVIVLTNGPQRGVARLISRGNKPWTTRRRLGLRGETAPLIVVGDQVLTDGLLAWRLGAEYLHLVLDEEREPARQVVLRRIGRTLSRAFFKHAQ